MQGHTCIILLLTIAAPLSSQLSGPPELSVQFSGPFLQRFPSEDWPLCSGHQSLSSLQCSPQSGAAALCILHTGPNKGKSLLALPFADYKWKIFVYTAGVQLIQSLCTLSPVSSPEPAPLISPIHTAAIQLCTNNYPGCFSLFSVYVCNSLTLYHHYIFQLLYTACTIHILPPKVIPLTLTLCITDTWKVCLWLHFKMQEKSTQYLRLLSILYYKSFYFADRVTTCTPPPNFIFLKTDITRI